MEDLTDKSKVIQSPGAAEDTVKVEREIPVRQDAELQPDEIEEFEERPITVTRPDDEVEAWTRPHEDLGLRELRFTYRPMSDRQHAAYLDALTTSKRPIVPTKRPGEKPVPRHLRRQAKRRAAKEGGSDFTLTSIAEINWQTLAEHVIDGEIYDSAGDKIKFDDPEDWSRVNPYVIEDIIGVVTGLNRDAAVAELEEQTGL